MATRNRSLVLAASQCLLLPSDTLLPFLYRTLTIQRPSIRQFPTTRRHAPHSRHSFSTTIPSAAPRDNAIPFERSPDKPIDPASLDPAIHHLSKYTTNPPSNSTITHGEKAVFDRIFQDIAASHPTNSRSPRRSSDEEREKEEEEDIELGKAFSEEDLPQLFDAAIRKQEEAVSSSSDSAQKKPNKDSSRVLSSMPGLGYLSEHLAPQTGKMGGGEEEEADLARAHEAYSTRVYELLDKAETDVEVWRVMEREVFALVEELKKRIRDAEKAA
ncbi:MAG: hypothetical protein Q9191_008226, partial [Dirinaria sp. TL-2023a]